MDDVREIPGWTGYGATPGGTVLKLANGRQITIGKNRRVLLSRDGKQVSVPHAQLMALAFCGPQPDGHRAKVVSGLYATAQTVAWVPDPKVQRTRELRTWRPGPLRRETSAGISVHTVEDHAALISVARPLPPTRCFSPYPWTWLGSISGDKSHEAILHANLIDHLIRGKWYRLEGLTSWIGARATRDAPAWDGAPVMDHEIPDVYADTHAFYITQVGRTGPFYVGYSKNVVRTVRSQRHVNFEPVYLRRMIHAGPDLVEHLRDQWSAHRVHGDWFRACPELVQAVRKLRPRYDY